jgi:hypothetical protein
MNTADLDPQIRSELEALRFAPEEGVVVAEPRGRGYGYWAGGVKATFDVESGFFYLFYRQRSPLEAARGGECFVAVSDDGLRFRDIWKATKEQFAANSIEVGCPVRDPSGEWRLYVSYEFSQGNYWRVDVLRGSSLEQLEPQARRTIVWPFDLGLVVIKDPTIYLRDGSYYGYFCVSARRIFQQHEDGVVRRVVGHDATALLISDDGLHFPELRYVFEPTGQGWDGVRGRINSLVPLSRGYAVPFDGGATIYDEYEEQCGLAYSEDGLSFQRLTHEGPWLSSPYGCVRYVYGLRVGSDVFFYYEYTTEDGSHELRAIRVKAPA